MLLKGTTVIGPMHVDYNVPNQDAFKTGQAAGFVIGIVCDGVSLNSRHQFSDSEIASNYCSQFMLNFLEEFLKEEMSDEEILSCLYQGFVGCANGLVEYLDTLSIPFYDCQTTVLCMLIKEGKLYAAMAGDGGILYQCAEGNAGMMVSAEKTSASVTPICDPQGWAFSTYTDTDNPVECALCASDGVFDPLLGLADGTTMVSTIQDLFSLDTLPKEEQQARLDALIEAIPSHDDRTCVVYSDR